MSSVFSAPPLTRLVTIVAQVDHGKTTLADSLIASNGIISERLAGTLRYLDSLEEEQRRGITMRTSAIALQHLYTTPQKKKKKDAAEKMVIHLLDSPGHMDFSSEVSSALQISDGALLVVDAVEGLCARTHQVLREAFVHEMVPLLIINKVDRLCTELGLSPTEAYLRLQRLLESINAASAAMVTAGATATTNVGQTEESDITMNKGVSEHDNHALDIQRKEACWTFEPSKGNVVFGSALFGWGLTIPSLARQMYRSKTITDLKPVQLKQCLFGDYKYGGGDGRVLKWKQNSDADSVPMFAKYGLEPIWNLYHAITGVSSNGGPSTIADYVQELLMNHYGFDHETSQKEWDKLTKGISNPDEMTLLRSLLQRVRPLSQAVLDAVCEVCPSPREASQRLRKRALALNPVPPPSVKTAVEECSVNKANLSDDQDKETVPMIAHVCKFFSTEPSHILRKATSTAPTSQSNESKESSTILMGVTRVLSGTIQSGKCYYCLGPKYQQNTEKTPPISSPVQLYLIMGNNSLLPVPAVPAGHVCAVGGIYTENNSKFPGDGTNSNFFTKTVTLSSCPESTPLRGFDAGRRPLVKVNVEPVNAGDASHLEKALLQLSLADASVEVTATSRGERLLACLGEIHLEQCLHDLKSLYFGGKELRQSSPIVEFGETTSWIEQERDDFEGFMKNSRNALPLRHTTLPPYNEEEGISWAKRGRARVLASGKTAAFHIRVIPLSLSIFQAIVREEKRQTTQKESNDVNSNDLFSADKEEADVSYDEELSQLSKALGYQMQGKSDVILASLMERMITTNANGNVLLESKGVRNGSCVKAISGNHVYIPEEEDLIAEEDYEKNFIPMVGREKAEKVLKQIQKGGLFSDVEDFEADDDDRAAHKLYQMEMSGSISAGFQLGLRAGPFCEEPVHRVAVILEAVEIALSPEQTALIKSVDKDDAANPRGSSKHHGLLSAGMIVAAIQRGIRCALLSRPARLVEASFRMTLHSSLDGLAGLYTVLNQRRGKVLEDDVVEGTNLLKITAVVPQAESFGLGPELLNQTKGEVTVPEWEKYHKFTLIAEDPFWIPTSLDEREDYGDYTYDCFSITNVDSSNGSSNQATSSSANVNTNRALLYIRQVRARKGLLVDSAKTVIAAEKQRTKKR